MILDGAVDPNADLIQADIDQARAFQEVPTTSPPTAPQGCRPPAGLTRAATPSTAIWWTLVDTPMPTLDPRGLSYNDAIVGTIMALYSP